ncbi:MAG: hypothetical protein ACLPPF_19705 [Rhodomicrobium sp.]
MNERDTIQTSSDKGEPGVRSPLLMPVMQGNTLESEDVSSFLAVRLAALAEEIAPQPARLLS